LPRPKDALAGGNLQTRDICSECKGNRGSRAQSGYHTESEKSRNCFLIHFFRTKKERKR